MYAASAPVRTLNTSTASVPFRTILEVCEENRVKKSSMAKQEKPYLCTTQFRISPVTSVLLTSTMDLSFSHTAGTDVLDPQSP